MLDLPQVKRVAEPLRTSDLMKFGLEHSLVLLSPP